MAALEDKIIVVTGAGRGIGEACARGLAAEGARVVVNDIDSELAETVAASIRNAGGRAVADLNDIACWSGAAALVRGCVDAFGRIDGLVNNAGLMRVDPAEEIAESDLDAMIAVNVVGTIGCAVHAIRQMRRQGTGGSIVNVTSGAQAGQANLSAYGATKGAVASFTYGCAIDLAGSGIRINAVSPIGETRLREVMDAFRTGHGQDADRSDGPPPSNNVPAIAYLLSDAAADVHGQIVRIDGAKLSLMTHPAICAPAIEQKEWSLSAVAQAFKDSLGGRQQPLGIVELRLA